MEINKQLFIEAVTSCHSKGAIIRKLGWSNNGRIMREIDGKIKKWNLDTSHFKTAGEINRKYPIITKVCPICGNSFATSKGAPDEKTTCSHSCANTHFRCGDNNGNWKERTYRTTCFKYHEKKCIVCGEKIIVEVHHFDNDHENNSPENLIPLCPTHHQYWHSRYRYIVENKVIKYRNNFIKNIYQSQHICCQ